MKPNPHRNVIKNRLKSGEKAWQIARDLDISTALVYYYGRSKSDNTDNVLAREKRKQQILFLLARGESISNIAAKMGVGATTISTDLMWYRVEFGVNTNQELLQEWMNRDGIKD